VQTTFTARWTRSWRIASLRHRSHRRRGRPPEKVADLMRSWDGRLSTDSVAASVTAWTRHSLWPLVFAPKLGNAAVDYEWAESDFATEEIVMHANPTGPQNLQNWDALLTTQCAGA